MADGRHIWDEHFIHDFPSDFEITRSEPDALTAVDGPVLTWLLDCKEVDPREVISESTGLGPERQSSTIGS